MKPIACLFSIAILSFILISCSKSEVNKKGEIQVAGKWKLTESLVDIGNGNGKWTKVSNSNVSYPYIIFKNDSTLESNIFVDMRRYSIIDSTKIRFTFFDNRKITYSYSMKNSSLVINPPCIEGCGYRFEKTD